MVDWFIWQSPKPRSMLFLFKILLSISDFLHPQIKIVALYTDILCRITTFSKILYRSWKKLHKMAQVCAYAIAYFYMRMIVNLLFPIIHFFLLRVIDL